jgi:serine/threonine protein kinase
LYSFEEIRDYYVNGIDPKDMAWMWRRLLNILGFVHKHQVIHGAVLPSHVLIEPKDHKLALTGWGYSLRNLAGTVNRLKAISTTYETWYPEEVFAKQPPKPGLDLMMAARCMLYLIGADPLGKVSHRNIEPDLERYFARFLEEIPERRPQDAWTALDEFDRIIEKLWGPRAFRVFRMPHKA